MLLSDIIVRIEVNADFLTIYAGLCTLAAGDGDTPSAPLMAVFSGGKNRPASVAERPPVLIPGGRVTIIFSTDGAADQPIAAVVQESVSVTWSTVGASTCPLPCLNGGSCIGGACQCANGWAGADCRHPACLGTVALVVGASPQSILHGPAPGTVHGADCRWVLTVAQPDEVVVLDFVFMDVESFQDPIRVYSGSAIDSSQLLGSFGGYTPAALGYAFGQPCPGPSCPSTVTSPGRSLTVRWTSDFVQSGRVFKLRASVLLM